MRTWLLLFAMIPLLGASLLAIDKIADTVSARRDMKATSALVDEAIAVAELRGAHAEHETYSSLGFDDEFEFGRAQRALTSDQHPTALANASLDTVERLVAELDWSELQTAFDGTGDASSLVDERLTQSIDTLVATASGIDGGSDLVAASRQLVAASDAQVVALAELRGDRASEAAYAQVLDQADDVSAAASSLSAADGILDAAVTEATKLAVARIGFLVAASFLFAVGLARAIGKPLRRLATGTRRLRDGRWTETLRPTGPSEVREAIAAINEAAAHIQLAERQAQALAAGDLENPSLHAASPGALGASLQEAVRTLAGSLNEREEFRRRLSHEANHDSLTQLANRKALLTQLEQSLARTARTGSTVAVLFIDLDGFKDVNDKHGHATGDAVLWALAKRFAKSVRTGDYVGRLGGDEFLIIAEPVTGAPEAKILAKRVAAQASQPLAVAGTTVEVTVSIGVAIADASTSLTATELLHDADLAVYRAKELGRSRIAFCDEALHRELAQRSVIERSLREAIENDELELYYQPILDAGSAELISLEALIRWNRAGIGMTPPDAFIPIAERSDLILEVDNWVVRRAVRQLDEWSTNPLLRRVPIAINISGRHLEADSFVGDILDPLLAAGVDPCRLVLEVTESALLEDREAAADKLQRLRDHSIRIAIDDFGTGYTSIEHLRSLPVDILKIDRTFINDESAESLVELIINIGHLLGTTVTSEGIETVEQAAHLTELGSDALQGYLFARPMPSAELEHQLAVAGPEKMPFVN